MSEELGWLLILGCFGIMLAITYMPMYIWILIGVLGIVIVGFLAWRKYDDVWGSKL